MTILVRIGLMVTLEIVLTIQNVVEVLVIYYKQELSQHVKILTQCNKVSMQEETQKIFLSQQGSNV